MMFSNKNNNDKDVLIVERRQLSMVIAGGISLLMLSFMVGYFWGKKDVAEEFATKMYQNSLADQIFTSMCSLYDVDITQELLDGLEQPTVLHEESSSENVVAQVLPQAVAPAIHVDTKSPETQHDTGYIAQLIGFGTKQAAQQFMQKLAKKNISTEIRTRSSVTKRGKNITWYQVVTQRFAQKEPLETLVARLQCEENIHGIQIIKV